MPAPPTPEEVVREARERVLGERLEMLTYTYDHEGYYTFTLLEVFVVLCVAWVYATCISMERLYGPSWWHVLLYTLSALTALWFWLRSKSWAKLTVRLCPGEPQALGGRVDYRPPGMAMGELKVKVGFVSEVLVTKTTSAWMLPWVRRRFSRKHCPVTLRVNHELLHAMTNPRGLTRFAPADLLHERLRLFAMRTQTVNIHYGDMVADRNVVDDSEAYLRLVASSRLLTAGWECEAAGKRPSF
jgi:hypothetical protein